MEFTIVALSTLNTFHSTYFSVFFFCFSRRKNILKLDSYLNAFNLSSHSIYIWSNICFFFTHLHTLESEREIDSCIAAWAMIDFRFQLAIVQHWFMDSARFFFLSLALILGQFVHRMKLCFYLLLTRLRSSDEFFLYFIFCISANYSSSANCSL